MHRLVLLTGDPELLELEDPPCPLERPQDDLSSSCGADPHCRFVGASSTDPVALRAAVSATASARD